MIDGQKLIKKIQKMKKLKAIEVVNENRYYIKPYGVDRNEDFYINNIQVSDELKTSGFTVNKKDKITFLPKTQTLLGYENGDIFMSVEEYNSKPQRYYDDTSEENVLRAIANKRELSNFIPKYKDIEFEDVEVEVCGYIKNTKSEFICCAATSRFDKSPVIYTINVNRITIDEYRKIKNEFSSHGEFESLDRSYLRFVKVNGSYIFGDSYPFCEIRNEQIFITLEEAKKGEENIRALVRDKVLKNVFIANGSSHKRTLIINQLRIIKKAKTKNTMSEMIDILISDIQEYKIKL